jgi:hypothetical protein
VVGKLLRVGLIEEVSAAASLPAWRRDNDAAPRALRIGKRGLAAIGVDGGAPQEAAEAQPTGQRAGSPKRPARAVALRKKGDLGPAAGGQARSRSIEAGQSAGAAAALAGRNH